MEAGAPHNIVASNGLQFPQGCVKDTEAWHTGQWDSWKLIVDKLQITAYFQMRCGLWKCTKMPLRPKTVVKMVWRTCSFSVNSNSEDCAKSLHCHFPFNCSLMLIRQCSCRYNDGINLHARLVVQGVRLVILDRETSYSHAIAAAGLSLQCLKSVRDTLQTMLISALIALSLCSTFQVTF